MAATQNTVLKLVPPPGDAGRLLVQGLVDLYKAIKGASFYPEGHPYRTAPLQRSFHALARLAEKRDVQLTVSRHGFAPGLEGAEGNPVLHQLARECLRRRIGGIIFSQGLLQKDLAAFVDLMSLDPQRSAGGGGFARRLHAAGARTVTVQQKDISAMWAKRGRAAGPDAVARTGGEEGLPPLQAPASHGTPPEKHTIAELLQLMAHEEVDARYQELGRELVEGFLAENARREPGTFVFLPILEELLRQHRDPQKGLPQREYALFALERLADGTADLLMEALERRECPDKEGILRVLSALGGKGVYPLIQRICLAEQVYQRKALASALVRLGPAAVVPVMAMLKDQRWYVVRNMVTILGELRSAGAVLELKKPLHHEDLRVRKETVRALMKIGGELAEATLVGLIDDADEVIARHAILSLGLMHSRLAVSPLLKVLERRDLLLKQIGIRKEAALALGRIGDRRATSALVGILSSRGLTLPRRRLELKLSVASALGTLGDEAALPALVRHCDRKGALGEACREAVDAIERVSGGTDD